MIGIPPTGDSTPMAQSSTRVNAISRTLPRLILGLLVTVGICASPVHKGEAFELTVTNNLEQQKSFALHYFDDTVKKWISRGWYNVPARTTKKYNFPESKSVSHAFMHSSVFCGGGGDDGIRRNIIDGAFKYYGDESCPPGKNMRHAPFIRFGMCVNGAHMIWGEESAQKAATQTTRKPAPKAVSAATLAQQEAEAVRLLNLDRKKKGLQPLASDPQLAKVARNHAIDMVKRGYFDHTNLQGQSPFDRLNANGIAFNAAAENIGQNTSVPELQSAWMASPGHRTNILTPGYTHVGIGLAAGEDGLLYGVQVFTGD